MRCMMGILLVVAWPALAQAGEGEPSESAPAAPAAAAPTEPGAPSTGTAAWDEKAAKVKVLVLSLKATQGLDETTAQLLDDLVTVELARYPDFDVISDADVRQLVELEAERAAVGCEMDSSCLAEIAGAMGAQYVVSGRIGTIGSRISLTFSLYDSTKATSVGRVNLSDDKIDAIADGIPAAIHELVAGLLAERRLRGKEGAPAVAAAAPAGTTAMAVSPEASPTAAPAAATAAPAEGGSSLRWWALTSSVVCWVGGASAVVAGVAFDVTGGILLNTQNTNLDVIDFVGPVLIGTGGLLGLVGAGLIFLWFGGGEASEPPADDEGMKS